MMNIVILDACILLGKSRFFQKNYAKSYSGFRT